MAMTAQERRAWETATRRAAQSQPKFSRLITDLFDRVRRGMTETKLAEAIRSNMLPFLISAVVAEAAKQYRSALKQAVYEAFTKGQIDVSEAVRDLKGGKQLWPLPQSTLALSPRDPRFRDLRVVREEIERQFPARLRDNVRVLVANNTPIYDDASALLWFRASDGAEADVIRQTGRIDVPGLSGIVLHAVNPVVNPQYGAAYPEQVVAVRVPIGRLTVLNPSEFRMPIGRAMTPEMSAKQIVEEGLDALRAHQKVATVERATTIDMRTGEVFYDATGSDEAIQLLDIGEGMQFAKAAPKDVILDVHTHPTGYGPVPFSDSDLIYAFSNPSLHQARVITDEFEWTMTRTPEFDALSPSRKSVEALEEVYRKYWDRARSEAGVPGYGLLPVETQAKLQDKAAYGFAKELGLKYQRLAKPEPKLYRATTAKPEPVASANVGALLADSTGVRRALTQPTANETIVTFAVRGPQGEVLVYRPRPGQPISLMDATQAQIEYGGVPAIIHWDLIRDEAVRRGAGPVAGDWENGFLTSTGRFVSRREAWEIADRADQITKGERDLGADVRAAGREPQLISESVKYRGKIPSQEVIDARAQYGDLAIREAFTQPGPEVEYIASAAVRTREGAVFTAPFHVQAAGAAWEASHTGPVPNTRAWEEYWNNQLTEGFVTTTGRFVSREEALVVAQQADQLTERAPEFIERQRAAGERPKLALEMLQGGYRPLPLEYAAAPVRQAFTTGPVGAGDPTIGIRFGYLDPAVEEAISTLDTRVMQTVESDLREMFRDYVEAGLHDGRSSQEIARGLRDFIGLSANQEAAVRNFEAMLRGDTPTGRHRYGEALTRALRDKRFDSVLERMKGSNESLPEDQIQRIVGAYRRKMVAYNAETYARTAANDAQRLAQDIAWKDAIGRGVVDPARLFKRWVGVMDDRERPSHVAMEGDTVRFDEAYSNGQHIPGESEWGCRCQSYVFVLTPDMEEREIGRVTTTGEATFDLNAVVGARVSSRARRPRSAQIEAALERAGVIPGEIPSDEDIETISEQEGIPHREVTAAAAQWARSHGLGRLLVDMTTEMPERERAALQKRIKSLEPDEAVEAALVASHQWDANERAIAINRKTGELVYDRVGEQYSVQNPHDALVRSPRDSLIQMHSHPKGFVQPFSNPDVSLLAYPSVHAIRLATDAGVYSFEKTPAFRHDLAQFGVGSAAEDVVGEQEAVEAKRVLNADLMERITQNLRAVGLSQAETANFGHSDFMRPDVLEAWEKALKQFADEWQLTYTLKHLPPRPRPRPPWTLEIPHANPALLAPIPKRRR